MSNQIEANQFNQLQNQIVATKKLARNLSVTEQQQQQQQQTTSNFNSFIDPLTVLQTTISINEPNPSYVQPRNWNLPSLLPTGLDPYTLKHQRDELIKTRIKWRLNELESLTANLPDHAAINPEAEDSSSSSASTTDLANQKIRALIEIKSLRFKSAHYESNELLTKFGKSVIKFHVEAEKEEQRRIERLSKERLKALRADDEEAYLKLIDTAKDTRITHLLRQTDQYLENLSVAVLQQQNDAVHRDGQIHVEQDQSTSMAIDESAFGAAPVFDDAAAATAQASTSAEGSKADYYNVAHRIKEEVTKQSSLLTGGQLKEYQVKGLQWMVSLYNNRLNGILADEMGLGKTIQTISLITWLMENKKQPGPYLVIVPLSTLPNWTLEFEKWAPTVKVVVYKGSPNIRKQLQNQIRQGAFEVLLTTYEYIIKDRPMLCKIKWVHMIIDEGHRMKNSQSKLSLTLTMHYQSRYRLILTGTPLQNNLPELWALLNFVLPKVFNSVKSFDEWFNTPFANTGGQDKIELNEEEAILVIRRLHKVLRPFLLRRLKKDVESELPDKVERVIKCKMSGLQLKLTNQMKVHKMIWTDVDQAANTAKGSAGTGGVMRVERTINGPHKPTNDTLWRAAGKFELLDRVLPKLFRTGHRRDQNLRLDGMTKPEERAELLKTFNHPECGVDLFILSTRAGGLGLNLQTADTVIIFDSDWNPHQDLQAQDRAHPGRFDHKSSAEEREMFLRELLEDEDNEEEGDNELGDDELNEMLKRSDEEYEIFTEMDRERVTEAIEQWNQTSEGQAGKPLPERLMTVEELPTVYSKDIAPIVFDPNAPEEEEEGGGRKARNKTAVHYDDGLTEEQFLEAVENEEDLTEVIAKKRGRRAVRQANKSKKRGAGNGSGEDEEGGEEEEEDEEDEEDDDFVGGNGGRSNNGRTSKLSRANSLLISIIILIKVILLNPIVKGNALLAVVKLGLMSLLMVVTLNAELERLPNYKETYSMKQIHKNISSKYKTFKQFKDDVYLMFDNARIYNETESYVYVQADELQDYFDHVFNCLVDENGKPREQPLPQRPANQERDSQDSSSSGEESNQDTPNLLPPPPPPQHQHQQQHSQHQQAHQHQQQAHQHQQQMQQQQLYQQQRFQQQHHQQLPPQPHQQLQPHQYQQYQQYQQHQQHQQQHQQHPHQPPY
ncbi:hypothetical protein PSTT_15364 [Puccinia striiformis]|uniref:Uncharacterized protein n=1 Tax=Puccinia striiformis TaxID=27350 RepID=A0A2S4UI70_9BASI|nr:hypothetical protein PSTT_15364 [Puccinia striiformis]